MRDPRRTRPDLVIRKAVAADAGVLTNVAHAAKRHWGYPEEWMALWRPGLTVSTADVVRNEVFVGLCGEEIAGFYALGRRNGGWELKHCWMLPEYMGRGFGRALFGHAVERLRQLAPGAALEVESDPNAEAFYLHMGCERVGEVHTDWQGLTRTLPLLRFHRRHDQPARADRRSPRPAPPRPDHREPVGGDCGDEGADFGPRE